MTFEEPTGVFNTSEITAVLLRTHGTLLYERSIEATRAILFFKLKKLAYVNGRFALLQ